MPDVRQSRLEDVTLSSATQDALPSSDDRNNMACQMSFSPAGSEQMVSSSSFDIKEDRVPEDPSSSSTTFQPMEVLGPEGRPRRSVWQRVTRRLPRPSLVGPTWSIEVLLTLLVRPHSLSPEVRSQWLIASSCFATLILIITACSSHWAMLSISFLLCLIAGIVGIVLIIGLLAIPEGSGEPQAVAGTIRQGSQAYVAVMFGRIYKLMVPMMALIFMFYICNGSLLQALAVTMSFALGACCSSLAGVANLWICTMANSRVAHTAYTSNTHNVLMVLLKSGTVVGILVVVLNILGLVFLLTLFNVLLEADITKVPMLLLGHSFGASFVALCVQLVGSIFVKAADISTDLCRQLVPVTPEDAPLNPTVAANLVGQNIGGCCACGADLFQSLSAACTCTMLFAGALAQQAKLSPDDAANFVLFPLAMPVINLVVSCCATLVLQLSADRRSVTGTQSEPSIIAREFRKGDQLVVGLSSFFFLVTSWAMLRSSGAPHAWRNFAMCGLVGMFACYVVMVIMEPYMHHYLTTQRHVSDTDLVPSIIGFSRGAEFFLPMMVICLTIYMSYFIGRNTTYGAHDPHHSAGIFGVAVAATGMLSTLSYTLAVESSIPIIKNAAGIIDMGPPGEEAAKTSIGQIENALQTTKALSIGFAMSSASLVSFLLFRALLNVAREKVGKSIYVDIVQPEVFISGTLGVMVVSVFCTMATHAVGTTAQHAVATVRRQFQEIADGDASVGELGSYVQDLTRVGFGHMLKPAMLASVTPVLVAFCARFVGTLSGDRLLGAKALTSYCICLAMTAMLESCVFNRKSVSSAPTGSSLPQIDSWLDHATVNRAPAQAETVYDVTKDTTGPLLQVLMKFTATVAIVVMPALVEPAATKADF